MRSRRIGIGVVVRRRLAADFRMLSALGHTGVVDRMGLVGVGRRELAGWGRSSDLLSL